MKRKRREEKADSKQTQREGGMVKFREGATSASSSALVHRVRGPGTDRATKHNGIRVILGGMEGFVQDQQTILSGRHLCPRKQP